MKSYEIEVVIREDTIMICQDYNDGHESIISVSPDQVDLLVTWLHAAKSTFEKPGERDDVDAPHSARTPRYKTHSVQLQRPGEN